MKKAVNEGLALLRNFQLARVSHMVWSRFTAIKFE